MIDAFSKCTIQGCFIYCAISPGGQRCFHHKLLRNRHEDSSELPVSVSEEVSAHHTRRFLDLTHSHTPLALPVHVLEMCSKRSLYSVCCRCGSKQGEEDYRPLFENFVHDLLSTVNKPEWPAAELLLSLLGRLLVSRIIRSSQLVPACPASLTFAFLCSRCTSSVTSRLKWLSGWHRWTTSAPSLLAYAKMRSLAGWIKRLLTA